LHLVVTVVFFLLGDTPVSEFYLPMFRNTLSVTSEMEQTVFQNVSTEKFTRWGITQKEEYNKKK
jgi:hypothetical protein